MSRDRGVWIFPCPRTQARTTPSAGIIVCDFFLYTHKYRKQDIGDTETHYQSPYSPHVIWSANMLQREVIFRFRQLSPASEPCRATAEEKPGGCGDRWRRQKNVAAVLGNTPCSIHQEPSSHLHQGEELLSHNDVDPSQAPSGLLPPMHCFPKDAESAAKDSTRLVCRCNNICMPLYIPPQHRASPTPIAAPKISSGAYSVPNTHTHINTPSSGFRQYICLINWMHWAAVPGYDFG